MRGVDGGKIPLSKRQELGTPCRPRNEAEDTHAWEAPGLASPVHTCTLEAEERCTLAADSSTHSEPGGTHSKTVGQDDPAYDPAQSLGQASSYLGEAEDGTGSHFLGGSPLCSSQKTWSVWTIQAALEMRWQQHRLLLRVAEWLLSQTLALKISGCQCERLAWHHRDHMRMRDLVYGSQAAGELVGEVDGNRDAVKVVAHNRGVRVHLAVVPYASEKWNENDGDEHDGQVEGEYTYDGQVGELDTRMAYEDHTRQVDLHSAYQGEDTGQMVEGQDNGTRLQRKERNMLGRAMVR